MSEGGLPLHHFGKLVVARSAADHPQFDELFRRGEANGLSLESMSEAERAPVKTHERAIWSPCTGTADTGAVLAAVRDNAER